MNLELKGKLLSIVEKIQKLNSLKSWNGFEHLKVHQKCMSKLEHVAKLLVDFHANGVFTKYAQFFVATNFKNGSDGWISILLRFFPFNARIQF